MNGVSNCFLPKLLETGVWNSNASFRGEKSIQGGGGLSQIHYNLYFISISMERLQAWGSV